jgi:hypothetical protein
MTRQIINASDTLPASRPKINENFEELYSDLGSARPLVRAGWDFATAAARDAETLTDDDIGFVCRVAAPLGYFLLRQRTPTVVWEQIGRVYAPVPAAIGSATYDLAAGDVGRWLRFTHSGAKTVNVLTSTDVVDGEWYIRNASSSGSITLVAGSGVTLAEPEAGGLVIPIRGSRVIKRIAPNSYEVA